MTLPPDSRPSTTAGQEADRSNTATKIGAICGAIGVVFAFIPGLFFVAWLLGAIAVAAGLPTFRRGRTASDYGTARFAVVAGALALVFGVVNLGIVLDWFTFFTTGTAVGPGRW